MKTKKLIRNIVIAAVVVILVVAAILLTLALRKDGHGLNWFERNRKVASADGASIKMYEYVLPLSNTLNMYQQYFGMDISSFTDEQLHNLQENAAKQALLLKVYTKEAKALGITLTDEELQSAKDSASKEIKEIEESYAEAMAKEGNYSKAALEKQLVSVYQQIGLNQTQYYNYLREQSEANTYMTKLEEYYTENGNEFSEEELIAYYDETVAEEIKGYEEMDDEAKKNYFSNAMNNYNSNGYSPVLFVPEGFIYIDYIKLEKESVEEITAIIEKVQNGELTFDELLESEDNKDPYKSKLILPYAMGENDHSYLFEADEAYAAAAALEIGEIGSFVETPAEPAADETAEDASSGETETKTVSGYLFRRAEGNMCEEGDSGVIRIDYYPGIRDTAETELREERWFADVKYEDAIFAYRGQN